MPILNESRSNSPAPSDDESRLDELVRLLRDGLAGNPESRWRPNNFTTKFGGRLYEDPRKFLEKVETFFTSDPPENVLERLNENFEGEAKQWLRPFLNIEMTWSSFKNRFLGHFNGPDARAKLNVVLLTDPQKEDELGRDYVARKMALAQRSQTENLPELVQTTINLMRLEYKLALIQRRLLNFDELLDFVIVLDEALPVAKPNQSSWRKPATLAAPTQAANAAKKGNPPGACYRCGGNHWIANCPQPRTTPPAKNAVSAEKPSRP